MNSIENTENTENTNNDTLESEMDRKIVIFISFYKKIETTPREIDAALGDNTLYNTLLNDEISNTEKQEILTRQIDKYIETVVLKQIQNENNEMYNITLNIFGKNIEISNYDYRIIRNFSIICILSTLFVIMVRITGTAASDFVYVIRCSFEVILYYYLFRFIRRGLDFIIK